MFTRNDCDTEETALSIRQRPDQLGSMDKRPSKRVHGTCKLLIIQKSEKSETKKFEPCGKEKPLAASTGLQLSKKNLKKILKKTQKKDLKKPHKCLKTTSEEKTTKKNSRRK